MAYDYNATSLDRLTLENRQVRSMWRYHELLPVNDASQPVTMGEGGTPLSNSDHLGEKVGLKTLYMKDETRNPTGAFKDRAVSVMISRARGDGFSSVVTASSGNASAATAAYCSRGGLQCYVLFQDGSPLEKTLQTLLYGATGLYVRKLFAGTPEDLSSILRAVAANCKAYNAFCWAPINPYALEGIKTIAYEIIEALGWRVPDFAVTATGGGDNLAGQWKGYVEFNKLGLVSRLPRMVCVQPEGAAALVNSWKRHLDHVETIKDPRTVASGLRAAYSGDHALKAIYDSKGLALTVSDEEILEAEKILARLEGIWVEPSSATAVAGLKKLKEMGVVESSDCVTCTLTGSGFKDVDVAKGMVTQPKVVDCEIGQIVEGLRAVRN